MKKLLLIFLFFGVFLFSASAKLQVQLSYCTFYSSASGPYVEFYLSIVADELVLQNSDQGYYGEIDVTYAFSKSANQAKLEQFIIQSPNIKSVDEAIPPFVSLHRIFLENGNYEVNIKIRDLSNDSSLIETDQTIEINYNSQDLTMSEIELYESAEPTTTESMFQKNGFEVIPYPYEILPVDLTSIGFYAELYNADKALGLDTAFLITYYLEDYEDGTVIPGFKGFSKKKASNANVIMGKFLLENLSGGNYYLKIDALNRNNELIASKKIAFHKVNPVFKPSDAYSYSFVDAYVNIDSLAEHIKYLEPIADRLEWDFAQNQLSNKDFDLMKKYFLNFWQQRNYSQPEVAWFNYLREVRITQENFTTPMIEGYLSPRGLRYLKYGKPNDRWESFDEPNAYPYEVWLYNRVNNQSNRTIIFVNKSMVMNDFMVLHSNITGERYNKDWNLELHRMAPGNYDAENPVVQDYFGNQTYEWMNYTR